MDDVAFANEDRWPSAMMTVFVMMMLLEPLFMVLEWRRLMIEVSFHGWTMAALIESEYPDHADREHSIEPALIAIDEQGSQDEVMDQEEYQEDAQIAPYHENLLPVEWQIAVASHPHKQAQQWCCEEQTPQHHVGHILVFRLFMHPHY